MYLTATPAMYDIVSIPLYRMTGLEPYCLFIVIRPEA